jgi:hypothetical protein
VRLRLRQEALRVVGHRGVSRRRRWPGRPAVRLPRTLGSRHGQRI